MSNEQVTPGLKYKFEPEDNDTYSNVNCTTPYGVLYRKYVISQKCVKVSHAFIIGKWFRLFFPNAGNLVIPFRIYKEISDNNRILVMADSMREWFAAGGSLASGMPFGKITEQEFSRESVDKQPKQSIGRFFSENVIELQDLLLEAAVTPITGNSHE